MNAGKKLVRQIAADLLQQKLSLSDDEVFCLVQKACAAKGKEYNPNRVHVELQADRALVRERKSILVKVLKDGKVVDLLGEEVRVFSLDRSEIWGTHHNWVELTPYVEVTIA